MNRGASCALLLAISSGSGGCGSDGAKGGSGGGTNEGSAISCPSPLRTLTLPARTADGTLDLAGRDLSCADLAGSDLTKADLSFANLSGSSLIAARFDRANLQDADLRGAHLDFATFDGADLSRADLRGADSQTRASFLDARLDSAKLVAAKLPGAQFGGATLTAVDASDADLSAASFAFANLIAANLSGASAKGAAFQLARAHDLLGCPLDVGPCVPTATGYLLVPATDFVGADLTGVDLSSLVQNIKSDLSLAPLRSYDLRGCPSVPDALAPSYFCVPQPADTGFVFLGPNVDLSGGSLSGVDLTGVHVTRLGPCPSTLDPGQRCLAFARNRPGNVLLGPGVALTAENFEEFDFKAADLSSADLSDANLTFANLTGVNLASAQLEGVMSAGLTGCPNALPARWTCASGNRTDPPQPGSGDALSGGALLGPKARLGMCGFKNMPDLSFADLRGVDLSEAEAFGVVFASADLRGARLTGIAASNANFAGADLSDADLSDAELGPVDLQGSTGCSAFLSGADLTDATLSGVTWSNTTCPDGSNSDADDGSCAGNLQIGQP